MNPSEHAYVNPPGPYSTQDMPQHPRLSASKEVKLIRLSSGSVVTRYGHIFVKFVYHNKTLTLIIFSREGHFCLKR